MMSNDPSTVLNNSGYVGAQIGYQVIQGSVHHTVTYNAPAVVTASNISDDEPKLDDALLASLAFPQMFDRRSTIEKPHLSTCEWILHLDEFKTWQSGSNGLLWIKGKPGAGKSTLMSFMYSTFKQERKHQPGVHLDFFFSARGCDLQKTPLGMFRSLLNQLFVQSEHVQPLIRSAFREKQLAFRSKLNEWSWQQRDLEDIFFDALTTTRECLQTTIFVDALDEAGDQNAQKLARFFHKLNDYIVSTSRKVKVCLSCRHYPFVSRVKAVEVCVEDHNKNDIALFIRDRLDIAALDRDDDWQEWQNLQSNLLERAGGIFQWADLAVAGVERGILQGDPPSMVEVWLKDVPQELRDCYEQILRTQIDKRHRLQSSLMFALICFTKRPLSLTELSLVLAVANLDPKVLRERKHLHSSIPSDKIMRQRVKTLSGGLIDAVCGNVQIIHQSVDDFLRVDGLDLVFELEDSVSPAFLSSILGTRPLSGIERSHMLLHRCCLNYIASIDPAIIYTFGSQQQEIFNVFPWLHYASFHLFVHAEYVASIEHVAMGPYIALLEAVFPHWLFIYRCRNAIYSTCPAPGSTLMHVAVTHRLRMIVQHLTRHGRDVNTKDERGYTALHLAAVSGSIELVEILIQGGADPVAMTSNGETFLDVSIAHSRSKFAAWVLQHDLCYSLLSTSVRALHIAAGTGQTELVSRLLELGSTLLAKEIMVERSGEEWLDGAQIVPVESRHVNIPNTWSREYCLAIQEASYFGHIDIVKMFIQATTHLNMVNVTYNSALCIAAEKGDAPLLELLLGAGASPNATFQAVNAMCLAAQKGHTEVVHILLRAGGDIVNDHGNGENAFETAAAYGKCDIVETLVTLIDQRHNRDAMYENALHKAVAGEHYDVVAFLLKVNPGRYNTRAIEYAAKAVKYSRTQHLDLQAYISGTYAPRLTRLRLGLRPASPSSLSSRKQPKKPYEKSFQQSSVEFAPNVPDHPKSIDKYESTMNLLFAYREESLLHDFTDSF